MRETLEVLRDLAKSASLSVELVEIVQIQDCSRFICQVRIELEASGSLFNFQQKRAESRVLFVGAGGCVKTTLLSVLSDWGVLDDARGKMRTRLLHHRHELLSGSTSSVIHQPLIFLNGPTPLNLTDESAGMLRLEGRKEILRSGRVVQLIDSGGKLRFDRTVFSGLTASAYPPQLAFIVLEAGVPLPAQTRETHQTLESLKIPVAVLVTKIDQADTETVTKLLEEFSGRVSVTRRLFIYDHQCENGESQISDGVPVLLSSAVTGDFLPILAHFIHSHAANQPPLSSSTQPQFNYARESAESLFIIEQVAQVADLGPVVYGQVAFGTVCVGDEMVLGPVDRGYEPIPVRINSIQRLKFPVLSASETQHVSLALHILSADSSLRLIRKGMALIKLRPEASHLSLKPLKRIIAEVDQISGLPQQQFTGIVFVMGQRFPATLNVQPRRHVRVRGNNNNNNQNIDKSTSSIHSKSKSSSLVALVSLSEKRPATVFLFPSAPIVFVACGKREKFVGKVIDYFA